MGTNTAAKWRIGNALSLDDGEFAVDMVLGEDEEFATAYVMLSRDAAHVLRVKPLWATSDSCDAYVSALAWLEDAANVAAIESACRHPNVRGAA